MFSHVVSRKPFLSVRTVLLLVGVVVVFFTVWPAKFGGFATFAVVSGPSMEPTFSSGHVAYASSLFTPTVGDVAVFAPQAGSEARVIHRVVASSPEGFLLTKGDGKLEVDPWTVPPDRVDGKVVLALPGVGSLLRVALSPWVLGVCATLAVLLLLWPTKRSRRPQHGAAKSLPAHAKGPSHV